MARSGLSALWRRPPGLLEQTGWLFWLSALLSLVLTLPPSFASGSPEGNLATLLAAAALVAPWARRYLRRRACLALSLRASAAHRDLARQASTDGLTGLANSSAFTAAVELHLAAGDGAPALLFLDLDDFTSVNDSLGHAAGDELLRVVADRVRGAVRAGDVCARLGGDEFAVLLADGDRANALRIAMRLAEVVGAPVVLSGRPTQVGASIGVVCGTPGPRVDAEQLLHRADVAMYAAKARGKHRVQEFDPTLLLVAGPDAVLA